MLTVQEAATQVKLTQWAIYRAIRRGDLVAYKPGWWLRIDELDLRAWLDSTRVSPAPAPDRLARQVPPSLALTGSKRSRVADGSLRARVRARRRNQPAA
jgi:excisionase family DNA binding protein